MTLTQTWSRSEAGKSPQSCWRVGLARNNNTTSKFHVEFLCEHPIPKGKKEKTTKTWTNLAMPGRFIHALIPVFWWVFSSLQEAAEIYPRADASVRRSLYRLHGYAIHRRVRDSLASSNALWNAVQLFPGTRTPGKPREFQREKEGNASTRPPLGWVSRYRWGFENIFASSLVLYLQNPTKKEKKYSQCTPRSTWLPLPQDILRNPHPQGIFSLSHWTIPHFKFPRKDLNPLQSQRTLGGAGRKRDPNFPKFPLICRFFLLPGIFCRHHILLLQWRGES